MKLLSHFAYQIMIVSIWSGCIGQTSQSVIQDMPGKNNTDVVGGPFENGHFMYIGMPEEVNSIDTSPGWTQNGQKLIITGTIYQQDGKTPASDVILYYYHTDINGYYSNRTGLDPKVVRHGYIRGWVKSDENGKYAIYTVRPGHYPGRDFEAHIHPSIKEPDIEKEYYIDEFVFDDDQLLTGEKRKILENRGGSGILRTLEKNDLQIAEHDIFLGLNIPNYPKKKVEEKQSGLQIGVDNPSFIPFHAWGPDRGTRTCPVCKYGRYHGIVYFVGNRPMWDEIKRWLNFLEQESVSRQKYLKVYLVYGNENNYDQDSRTKELEQIGRELDIRSIALTFVPSLLDKESEVYRNKIDPEVQNTFVIYRHRIIVDKFVDLKPTENNFSMIEDALDRTQSDYFELKEPGHE